jgi:hypothetical protein
MREFWLHDRRSLEQVSSIVEREFGAALSGDAENRYEWFEGQRQREGLAFNISRDHSVSRMAPGNPVRISLSGPAFREDSLPAIGARLARCLQQRIALGDVVYLGGDDFRFDERQAFEPEVLPGLPPAVGGHIEHVHGERTISYDNHAPTRYEDDPSMVEVGRIYCLDFDRFSTDHWSQLDTLYRTLPGNYRKRQNPMWFGSDEDAPPFLWASVEPPGLQVYGILPLQVWEAWDAEFATGLEAAAFPFRDL